MRSARLAPLLLLALLGASCLPDARPVEGRQLFAGRDLVRPEVIEIDGVPSVLFEQRTSPATATSKGTFDLFAVPWESGKARTLLRNRSARWNGERREGPDRDGLYHFMVDERLFSTGGPAGVQLPVATLARVSLSTGVVETFPDVTSYGVIADERQHYLQYRRMIAGSPLPEIHLRPLSGGLDRVIGTGNGPVEIFPNGHIYLTSGEDRVLTRLTAFDAEPEVLRRNVTRFLLRRDERQAVLAVTEMGRSETVLFDLETRVERKMPLDPCCWIGFSARGFEYAESGTSSSPARLHSIDLETFTDTVRLTLPLGMRDLAGAITRPNSDEELLFDSERRIAVRKAGATSDLRLLDLRPLYPSFTEDGRSLLYVEPEVMEPEPEGRLMIVDADFMTPPRQLSPPGARLRRRSFFFIDGPEPLVFWAYFGRGASDLYFANPETGKNRVVARSISEVTVTRRRILGIVRVSMQDLTGDFVERDPVTGDEVIVAHSVSDIAVAGDRAVFVIRERTASEREGLWAVSIEDRRKLAGKAGATGEPDEASP